MGRLKDPYAYMDYSPETLEWARQLKRGALARFTSEELIEELRERSNRRVIEVNFRTTQEGTNAQK